MKPTELIERSAERLLWGSRLVAIVAVVGSLLVGFGLYFVATTDAYYFLSSLRDYSRFDLDQAGRDALRTKLVGHAIEVIDSYLLATMMLIFSFGLYELFISRIDTAAKDTEISSRVLLIGSIDDLKDRLAKVVVLILIVKLFERGLEMSYVGPLDLLYLSSAILLVSAALYLSHKRPETSKNS